LRDFTITLFTELLLAFKEARYQFITYRCYMKGAIPAGPFVILRHDIDDKPQRALMLAELEHELNISGTYYIRNTPKTFDRRLIKRIAALDHEIGYHYEDLSRHGGNTEKAIQSFAAFLKELRTICAVHTICMHGSPLSKHDNKKLWQHYRYRDHGIMAELYLDTDFNKLLYLTDTGRSWNSRFNIRDRVSSNIKHNIRGTAELIEHVQQGLLSQQIMMTIHPQRWTNDWKAWLLELAFQNTKNIGKAILQYARS
jgi:hypothetical protein